MALLSAYYVNGTSGSDTTGTGAIGAPFATLQKALDTIGTESSNNLVTAASGELPVYLVAGNCGADENLSGITDDATNYIKIIGEVHATKVMWDTGKPYIQCSGASNESALDNSLNYTRLESVQIEVIDGSGVIGIYNTGTDCILDRVMVRGPDDGTNGNIVGIYTVNASGTNKVRNCVVYGIEATTGYNSNFRHTGAGSVDWQNCIGAGDPAAAGYLYGFRGAGNATNCYSSADAAYSGVTSITTSAAHNTEGSPAALDTVTLTTTNFTDPLNATSTSRDFTRVTASAMTAAGTDLTAQFPNDYLGNPYSSGSPDVGANAEIAGGDTTVVSTTEELVLAEQAAAVAFDISITSVVGALAIATPTASVTLDTGVTSVTDALTLSELAASVSLDIDIVSVTDTLDIVTYPASLAADTAITSVVSALTLTTYPASLTTGVTVEAVTTSLTLAELSAGIAVDRDVASVTASLVVATPASNVALDRDITSVADSLVIATPTATITLDTTITSVTDSLTLVELAANVSADNSLSAATSALAIATPAAVVSLDVDITSVTAALVLTESAATVSSGTAIVSVTAPLVIAAPTASISLDVAVLSVTEALAIATYTASVASILAVDSVTEALDIATYPAVISYDVNVTAVTKPLVIGTYKSIASFRLYNAAPVNTSNSLLDLNLDNIPQVEDQGTYEAMLQIHSAFDILLKKIEELEP